MFDKPGIVIGSMQQNDTTSYRMIRPDAASFRTACGQFATGVAVVTAQGPAGPPIGLTINSFSSVSLDPPLVLFCLGRDAQCMTGFDAADGFVIHMLGANQRDLSARFATPDADRFQGLDWLQGPCGPVLPGALARFDCRRHATVDGGDHVILIGRVEAVSVPDTAEDPLVYFRGGYRTIC